MLKKICLIVLGLLIVVGLTSCGGKTVEKSGSEALSLIDVEFKSYVMIIELLLVNIIMKKTQ